MATKPKKIPVKRAVNKSTGPVTAEGKNRSSKNALLHGATSKQLLNEKEQAKYDLLLNDLRETYPSKNPLVKLQLERIAKINIQLERIQDTIDAQFLKSRSLSKGYQNIANLLEMDNETKCIALNIMMGLGGQDKILDTEKLEISNELNYWVDSERPRAHQEFLEKTPAFCEYLFNEAQENQLTVQDFIAENVPIEKQVSGSPYSPGIKWKIVFAGQKPKIDQNFRDAITNTDLKELKRAAEWYAQEIMRVIVRSQKIMDFRKLAPIEQESMMPDSDQLDKLMRYQTTLQRQLSTAIGELLQLTR
jgi:hypothetical protein